MFTAFITCCDLFLGNEKYDSLSISARPGQTKHIAMFELAAVVIVSL